MATEFDEVPGMIGQIRQNRFDCQIDMHTIGADVVERGTRQHAPPWTRVPVPFRIVIAVEQEMVRRVERHIAGQEIAQDECFEEPCRVRQMPFGRGRVRHRLDGSIGIGKRFGKTHRQRPHIAKPA